MRSQIKLGRIFGIEIGLHYSWFLIALLIAFSLSSQFHTTNPRWGDGLILTLSIVTAILFFVRMAMYGSAHQGAMSAWYDIPLNIRAPMYVNPFFFLTASFAPLKQLYPAWVTCACVFVAVGALAVVLTLRNLRGLGEV